jgi:hypothetical protein
VGCSEAAWHKLQAAARAASCRRWETLSYGGQGGERGDGNDTISAGDLAGAMHEEDEAPQLREDKRKCAAPAAARAGPL